MNRNFEDRKATKVYAKSKENQAIIKALNMYGRVPEQWELLNEIDKLNKTIDTILEYNIFKDECPLNYGYNTESDEEKAQNIFNEEYCDKCKDDYKKCWLDYFEELKRLKEEKNEQK